MARSSKLTCFLHILPCEFRASLPALLVLNGLSDFRSTPRKAPGHGPVRGRHPDGDAEDPGHGDAASPQDLRRQIARPQPGTPFGVHILRTDMRDSLQNELEFPPLNMPARYQTHVGSLTGQIKRLTPNYDERHFLVRAFEHLSVGCFGSRPDEIFLRME